jgi:mRNA deadenylase 3'-5' endonuclease subunit Ccr4
MITFGNFKEIGNLSNYDYAAMLISAAVHDYDHPGTNNPYLVNTKHYLSIRYNDRSVLENYHIASAFEMMAKKDQNIFENLDFEEYK